MALKIKKENFISGLLRGDFWQPLILHQKRGRSARTASFTARPFSVLRSSRKPDDDTGDKGDKGT